VFLVANFEIASCFRPTLLSALKNSPSFRRGAPLSAKRKRRTNITNKRQDSDDAAEVPQSNLSSVGSSPSPSLFSPVLDDVRQLVGIRASTYESKLAPMSGTGAEKRESYLNEKSDFERFLDDLTAPTLPGEEPKSIKLAKNITWLAVGVLVLIEIYVSVKVGGMPFDTSKSTGILPKFPDMSELFTPLFKKGP
jgi:hypothetical protein